MASLGIGYRSLNINLKTGSSGASDLGKFNLLGGQSNLLSGQMPTQLMYYLPPW